MFSLFWKAVAIDLRAFRFILTETEDLRLKISEMTQRICQLEEALALLQSNISSEIHPLLQKEMSFTKHGTEKLPSDMPGSRDDIYADVVDAFGTLTIGDSGEVRYFGASAGSEVCYQTYISSEVLTFGDILSTNRPYFWYAFSSMF